MGEELKRIGEPSWKPLDRSPRRVFSDPLYAVIGESARETGQ
jgi:hypothetical protein